MIKYKKQVLIVMGLFALVLILVTTTYAFFNYTRTGSANVARTGQINFSSTQSNTLNVTNVFPISASDAADANLDAVSIRIWGNTTYPNGEEYEVSIVDVNNTIGSGASTKTIPINYIATYIATPVQSGNPNVIGTNSSSYFTARGQSSAVYQLSTTGEATNGEQVLIGFIPSGATGVDGTLTIKAYLDSSKIAISDTYDESNPGTANMGTTSEWVDDRVILTTTEWNALQTNGVSFQIKVESNEGTWAEDSNLTLLLPETISTCVGCKYLYTTEEFSYGEDYDTMSDFEYFGISLQEDYRILGKQYFIGLIIDEPTGEVTKAYACGIKVDNPNAGTPFCITVKRGENDNYSEFQGDVDILRSVFGSTIVDNVGCSNTAGNTISCWDSRVGASYGNLSGEHYVNVWDEIANGYNCMATNFRFRCQEGY